MLARKNLCRPPYLSVLDYKDVIYMYAASCTLHLSDSASPVLYDLKSTLPPTLIIGWPSLSLCRQFHLHISIFEVIMGKPVCNSLMETSSSFIFFFGFIPPGGFLTTWGSDDDDGFALSWVRLFA